MSQKGFEEQDLFRYAFPTFSSVCTRAINMRYRVRSGVLKFRFWSALGSNFNCCTALGIKEGNRALHSSSAYAFILSELD